ncbi:type IV pilus assembly protein PilM [Caloramator quimbayensis]|uniref:Type IV pilus assembly protein PilM n=1 Tax=Caloramator quimbayensis TaxID=1147123 RepID=A0A1T4WZA9_9CLOT|nr:pilus assembly protein PilM [Caloramator quimbayensis]SKA82205.1 type IV pilus assembly protein PilM [Caloramator quimbayensis]
MFNSLSIELNNTYVKIAEGKRGRKLKVINCKEVSIESEVNIVSDLYNETDILNALNKYLVENKVSKFDVNVVLSGVTNLLVREIILPFVSQDRIYDMLKFESPQYFPVNIDKYILDYKIIEVIKEGKNKKLRLLVYAIPKSIIEQVISIMNKLNMKINKIDIESNVLSKLSSKLGIGKNEDSMLINIERSFLTCVIIKNDIIQLTKTYPYDMKDMLYNRDRDDFAVDEYKLNEIIDNVVKLIEFYRMRERQEINKIYITGELCSCFDISNILSKKTGIVAEILNKLEFIDCKNDTKLEDYIIPISTLL